MNKMADDAFSMNLLCEKKKQFQCGSVRTMDILECERKVLQKSVWSCS